MTLLYQHERYLDHQTGAHPERPLRLTRIRERLATAGLEARCARPDWRPATIDEIALNHDRGYVESVAAFADRGGGHIEADTVVSQGSFAAAALATGAACDALRRVLAGEEKTALSLHRPPGHHALPDAAMGFCLFNHVAIAARLAVQEFQLNRVLVVDWDVHHGNGTQDSFWRDGQVAFFSSHRFPFYPGSGDADETGAGPGLGRIRNLPIRFGTSRKEILAGFAAELQRLADQVRPELVLLSAGFDAHREDPIGSLGLETEDFAALTTTVREIADVHAGGRLVSLLEGGYDVDRLADCVAVHLGELLGNA